MRKAVFVLVTVAAAAVLVFVVVELVAMVAFFVSKGQFVSARERMRREADKYVAEVTRGGECQYIDSLFPHPYLGFVHHGNPPCGVSDINNIGLFGPDFPLEPIPDRFVVLLTGGSVAAQFGQVRRDGPRYLELALNARYTSPTGKPFLVLNGGDGAWKQPQQAILFLLYSDVVNAVVTLDGFNEYPALVRDVRFEFPENNFIIVNPFAGDSYDVVIRRWLLGRLVGYASRNVVLSHSHAVYSILRGVRSYLERGARPSRDGRRTTIQSIFALPVEWDREKRVAWSLAQYKKYIRGLNAMARDRRVLTAFFIQPVPAIGKRLTEEERQVIGDLKYGPLYQRMTDSLLELRGQGIPVFSLLNIFQSVDRSLYSDHAHLRQEAGGESPGNRMMAEAMARHLAETWKLKPKGKVRRADGE